MLCILKLFSRNDVWSITNTFSFIMLKGVIFRGIKWDLCLQQWKSRNQSNLIIKLEILYEILWKQKNHQNITKQTCLALETDGPWSRCIASINIAVVLNACGTLYTPEGKAWKWGKEMRDGLHVSSLDGWKYRSSKALSPSDIFLTIGGWHEEPSFNFRPRGINCSIASSTNWTCGLHIWGIYNRTVRSGHTPSQKQNIIFFIYISPFWDLNGNWNSWFHHYACASVPSCCLLVFSSNLSAQILHRLEQVIPVKGKLEQKM